jgi:hypothetical protein
MQYIRLVSIENDWRGGNAKVIALAAARDDPRRCTCDHVICRAVSVRRREVYYLARSEDLFIRGFVINAMGCNKETNG